MTATVTRARADEAETLALGGLEWLLGSARDTGNGGLGWSGTPSDDELDPTLYSGAAGIVLALLEGRAHFGDDRYGDAALRGARSIAAAVEDWEHNSLYFGLTGMAFTLHEVHRLLGDAAAGAAAERALALVRGRFDGERWGPQFELLGGNAGIALGALHCGDRELALLAVTPYLRTAEPTPGGVHWEVRSGTVARFHHISHGTLGIVYALAKVGRATDRSDLVELALAGASDMVAPPTPRPSPTTPRPTRPRPPDARPSARRRRTSPQQCGAGRQFGVRISGEPGRALDEPALAKVRELRLGACHQPFVIRAEFLAKAITAVRDTVSGRRKLAKYGDPEAHQRGPQVRDAAISDHYRPTQMPWGGGM